jgi:hypothetical protein
MELSAVNQIVGKVASAVLKNFEVIRVDSEPMADSYGQDALNVTVILKGGAGHEISGEEALSAMVRIRRDLEEAGESRYPFVDFFSEDDLELDGSPQSQ